MSKATRNRSNVVVPARIRKYAGYLNTRRRGKKLIVVIREA